MFKPGSSVNELTMAGERVMLQNTNSSGTTKLFDTSAMSDVELQRRVFDYAGELSGNAPIEKVLKNGVPLEGRWSAKLQDGTTIDVRSVSKSGTGRWTVEILESSQMKKINENMGKKIEIKFI